MDLQIRKAQSNEENLIRVLLQSQHGDCSNFDTNRFIIAIDEDRLVGCVRTKELDNECIELSSLVVTREYRGKGVGTRLVNKILRKVTQRPIYLLCMDSKEVFYRNTGFRIFKPISLPNAMYKEYQRVTEKMPQIKDKIIAMCLE